MKESKNGVGKEKEEQDKEYVNHKEQIEEENFKRREGKANLKRKRKRKQ